MTFKILNRSVSIMVHFPKKCEICFHKKVPFKTKKEFEDHAFTTHFPFIKDTLLKTQYPVQCKLCEEALSSYQSGLRHFKNDHKVLSEAYEKTSIAFKMLKNNSKNITDETIAFFIKIWKSDEKFAPSIERIKSITRKNMPIVDDNEVIKKVQIKFISDTITTLMKDKDPPSRKRIRLDSNPDEQSSSINGFNPDGNLIKSLENITKEIQKLSQENAKLKVKTETLERMN